MNIDGTTFIVSNGGAEENGEIVLVKVSEVEDNIQQGRLMPVHVVDTSNVGDAASQFISGGAVVTMTPGDPSPEDGVEHAGDGTMLMENDPKSLEALEDEFVGRSPGVAWPKNAVLRLITLHQEHQPLFDNSHYKKRSIWEMIARKMRENNMKYSWAQAENKWKSLTKRFRDTVDYNVKHDDGAFPHTCPFYEELSEAYAYVSPISNYAFHTNTQPTATIMPVHSSLKRPLAEMMGTLSESDLAPLRKKKYQNSTTSSSSSPTTTNIAPAQSTPGQAVSQSVDLVVLLKAIHEDRKRQDKIKMERLERMHREKMDMFKQFLQIITESKNK